MLLFFSSIKQITILKKILEEVQINNYLEGTLLHHKSSVFFTITKIVRAL